MSFESIVDAGIKMFYSILKVIGVLLLVMILLSTCMNSSEEDGRVESKASADAVKSNAEGGGSTGMIKAEMASSLNRVRLLDYADIDKIPAELSWIKKVSENCNGYMRSKNDIQRSRFYNLNNAYIKGLAIDNLRVGVRSIETDKGGTLVDLEFYEPNSDLLLLQVSIPSDSNVYRAASEFEHKECAVISGFISSAASIFEKSEVCMPHYNIRISEIKKCEK